MKNQIQKLINSVPLVVVAILITLSLKDLKKEGNNLSFVGELFSSSNANSENGWEVTSIADGDTITVTRGGEEKRIRFCGIDAPETAHGNKAGQPLGNEAKDYLKSLIESAGNQVILVPIEQDRYGRTVAEIFVRNDPTSPEEKFLNSEMVQAGFAYHYARYSGSCPNKDSIERAEAIAQSSRAGVWNLPNGGQRPWDFRRN